MNLIDQIYLIGGIPTVVMGVFFYPYALTLIPFVPWACVCQLASLIPEGAVLAAEEAPAIGAAASRLIPIILSILGLLGPKIAKGLAHHVISHSRKRAQSCRFCGAEKILSKPGSRRGYGRRSTKKARRSQAKSAKRKGHHKRRGNPAGLIKAIQSNPRMSASTKVKAIKKLRAKL